MLVPWWYTPVMLVPWWYTPVMLVPWEVEGRGSNVQASSATPGVCAKPEVRETRGGEVGRKSHPWFRDIEILKLF